MAGNATVDRIDVLRVRAFAHCVLDIYWQDSKTLIRQMILVAVQLTGNPVKRRTASGRPFF